MQFTEEEKNALHHERFHHPHPRVQQKMEALLAGGKTRLHI